MRTYHRAFLALALSSLQSAGVGALKISAPQPGEVIDVDELYNLTWTVEGLSPAYKVESIGVDSPDYTVVTSESSYYYLQGFGADEKFNISATKGYHLVNLTKWWTPAYKELPEGMWTISIEVSNEWISSTRQNDSVQVHLTSHKPYQRPLLPPIQNFTSESLKTRHQPSGASSGVWRVVLSIVIPFLIITALGWAVRRRWTYHEYTSISHNSDIEPTDTASSECTPESLSENHSLPQDANATKKHRLPRLFLLATFAALGPLTALLIALVSLLLQYKVEPTANARSDFWFNQSGHDPGAFFIQYDATRYTTVASWTSSIALLLPGFLTTLIWHRQSHRLERDTTNAEYDSLLTPYQLSLLLSLKSGTIGSLLDYLLYICSRRREKQARFLFDAGFVVLMSTVLGLGIWAADTWLHVTTSTVPLSVARTVSQEDSYFQFGRTLWQNCSSQYLAETDQTWSCALVSSGLADLPPILVDGFGYASLISGRHDTTAIKLVTLEQERMAYIAPDQVYQYRDYRANTVAVRSTCENIDRWCTIPRQDGSSGNAFLAHCGKFVGLNFTSSDAIANATTTNSGVVGAITSYFEDQDWQNPLTFREASNSFFTVSRLDSTVKPTFDGLPAYWIADKSGAHYASFIGCHTEFVNFTYTYVNGSIRTADVSSLDNLDVANAIFLPAMMDWDPFLNSGAATVMTARTVESALESWVDTLHLHYLPFAAIVMDEVDNIAEQVRSPMLVARIPKAPLFTLGTLLVLSITFNCLILVASLWKTSLVRTHGKQLMVTIAGLAASKFDNTVSEKAAEIDSTWQLFTESDEKAPSTRVGINGNGAGGHHFVSFVGRSTDLSGQEDVTKQARVVTNPL
ncbi:hypothetical protein BKA66DRAFT_578240 [Pyrenochaeta sp. MPI-SDFR-AT-0127]|nr:hypothetical protein BKA66DRAFT_578240 [Pyrenochaeta sp. MPI-SDFR-AT-0127]